MRVVSSVVVSVRLSFFDDDGHDRVEVVRWVVGRPGVEEIKLNRIVPLIMYCHGTPMNVRFRFSARR